RGIPSDSTPGATGSRSVCRRSCVPGSSAARRVLRAAEIQETRAGHESRKARVACAVTRTLAAPREFGSAKIFSLRAANHRLRGAVLPLLWRAERVASQLHHLLQVPPFTRVHRPAFVIREID